jgi:hypothetical protein
MFCFLFFKFGGSFSCPTGTSSKKQPQTSSKSSKEFHTIIQTSSKNINTLSVVCCAAVNTFEDHPHIIPLQKTKLVKTSTPSSEN